MAKQKEENKGSGLKVKILIGLATVVLITFMFPRGESIESEITIGSIWTHEDLIAPFSFPIKKDPQIYQNEVNAAETGVYPVFVRNSNAVFLSLDSLKSYETYLRKISAEISKNDTSGNLNPTFLSDDSFNTIKNLIGGENLLLGEHQVTARKFFSVIENAINYVYRKGIILVPDNLTRKDSKNRKL